jgi:protein-arginine kinase activator protein McsA
MAKTRQNRYEAEHTANNAFVKRVQAEQARHGGRTPNLKAEALNFNAYMCNNGEHAQELAKDITGGLDKVAFPVK